MTSTEKAATDKALRATFRNMDGNKAQEIRETYYKSVEGMRTLADALEIADADQPDSPGPLLTENLYACEALDAMCHSRLGAFL